MLHEYKFYIATIVQEYIFVYDSYISRTETKLLFTKYSTGHKKGIQISSEIRD